MTVDVDAYGAKGDGQSDNTNAFSQAISAVQKGGGGTVVVPAGYFAFTSKRTPNPASILIEGSAPVALRGAGRDRTTLVESVGNKGLLSVRVDRTVVEDLTLDTQTHDGGAAIFVQANHTALLRTQVRGGGRHFALYYAGPKGAKPLAASYNTGNIVSDLDLDDLVCDDGFSWSFQEDSKISNVRHTGSRLALYVDKSTSVSNYTYTPGKQQCQARSAFWLTPPASDITIGEFVSSGEGGMIGVIGSRGAGKVASNVTIRGLRMTGNGFRLAIGDVNNLVLEDCDLGSNEIVIKSQAFAQGTVRNCRYGQLVRNSTGTAQVNISFPKPG